MQTLNLNETLFAVWEIKQHAIDIRYLCNKIAENERDIKDRPSSELNAHRQHLIETMLKEIEEKKALIKEYANEL